MRVNTYSLADYTLTIKYNDDNESVTPSVVKSIIGSGYTIGGPGNNGEGSFVGSITVSRNSSLWDTSGDHTGSWVHNQNLDRTGAITISINQISEDVIKFAQICSAYETIQGKYGGLQLIVTSANGVQGIVATGDDCFIKQIPSQNLGDSADNQPWEFTCGRIQFYPDANV